MGQRQNTAVKLTMIIKITQYQKSTNGNNAYKRSNPNNSIKIVDALMKTFRLEYVFGPNEEELEHLKVLGNGGFGIVYKARHKTLDIAVAIKCLFPRAKSEDYYKVFVKELLALDPPIVNDDQHLSSDQITIVSKQQPDTLYDPDKVETTNPPAERIKMSDHRLIDELLRIFESSLKKSTFAIVPANNIKKWIKQMNYKEEEVLHVLVSNHDYKDSLLLIGLFYAQNIGTDCEWASAYNRFLESFNKGNRKATYWLGLCYENGFGEVAANSRTALTYYIQAAKSGYPVAQCKVGRIYEEGVVVTKDMVSAIKFYEKAAKHDNLVALSQLAEIYENGIYVRKDLKKAMLLYKQIVDTGSDSWAMTSYLRTKARREAELEQFYKRAGVFSFAVKIFIN
ncbi:4038_t:CDS:2 [Paraglomus brasilianum]|uniref:4038_t:CDS:1 n=1 Tax=Paraglomus brasilianum TaxID=144538 RepID=A0A9N9GWF3_9GLOM|nr:4038_t:CDS:2 [Paraglomus brasilianum]